jgi:hypothetical protein
MPTQVLNDGSGLTIYKRLPRVSLECHNGMVNLSIGRSKTINCDQLSEQVGKAANDTDLEVAGRAEKKAGSVQEWIGPCGKGHRRVEAYPHRLAKAQEGAMSQIVVERTAEQIGKSARQASRASSAIADAIEDGVGVVRRAAKRGGDLDASSGTSS